MNECNVPDDIYAVPTDFGELALHYPPLRPHLCPIPRGGWALDFKNVESQRQLAGALLSRDFGLSLVLPKDRLCPAIPNRFTYVKWIRNAMKATIPDNSVRIIGLDIGTGASAIYPMLACAMETTWNMIGTDVDEVSLQYARENVIANKLEGQIQIRQSTLDGPLLLPLSDLSVSSFGFVMCNPPFYMDREDVARSAEAKEFDPHAVCTGADVEMITPGGEVGFVKRILSESLRLRERCGLFSSLLGKLSSLTEIVEELRIQAIDNYAIAEIAQGQTRRWIVAWSFQDSRLPDTLARPSSPSLRQLVPQTNTIWHCYNAELVKSTDHLLTCLLAAVEAIDGLSIGRSSPQTPRGVGSLLVSAQRNTWSRAARRRRMNELQEVEVASMPQEGSLPVFLICEINLATPGEANDAYALIGSWRKGRLRGEFESFWSHITRKVADALLVT